MKDFDDIDNMSKEEIVDRLLVVFASYDRDMMMRLVTGSLTKKDMKEMKVALKIMDRMPIGITDGKNYKRR